ncbi:MAG: hypothetical protein ACK5L6_02750 [Anaerorhabdus sp.]|uniref:hypothetical protein n=1 Tax=Anaerorhabdus sp. TaxID=1872524 RepID=UPI003A897A33
MIDPVKVEEACSSTDWVSSTVREIHLMWLDVYKINHVAGYFMLVSLVFILWYFIHTMKSSGKNLLGNITGGASD